jgi:hypothetical protein
VKFVRVIVTVTGVLALCVTLAVLADSPMAIELGVLMLSAHEPHAASAATARVMKVR